MLGALMNRRDFSLQLAYASAAAALAGCHPTSGAAPAGGAPVPDVAHPNAMEAFVDAIANGDPAMRARIVPSTTRRIGMLIYPGMYPLDLLGPKTVFNDLLNTQTLLVSRDLSPVRVGPGIIAQPDVTYATCPTGLDVLFVPGGGPATVALMKDAPTLAFLRTQAESARWVTSVCTGSLVLGAAGLLKGYRATTHWVTHEVLSLLGAVPVHRRVVEDRNRITGAGVTAGLDMALTLAGRLAGEDYARAEQLNIEYDPDPPFRAGNPKGAGPRITKAMRGMYADLATQAAANARAVG
jgi:cyclohexyl-isocyanide hydratase